MTMEVEEVQAKMEDEAKASGNTSEKVLVDAELLKTLFRVLSKEDDDYVFKYRGFYKVNKDKEVEFFYARWEDEFEYSGWDQIGNAGVLDDAKKQGFLGPELSNLSFEEIKKLGETQEPGIYFKGKKVWDL